MSNTRNITATAPSTLTQQCPLLNPGQNPFATCLSGGAPCPPNNGSHTTSARSNILRMAWKDTILSTVCGSASRLRIEKSLHASAQSYAFCFFFVCRKHRSCPEPAAKLPGSPLSLRRPRSSPFLRRGASPSRCVFEIRWGKLGRPTCFRFFPASFLQFLQYLSPPAEPPGNSRTRKCYPTAKKRLTTP